MIEDTRATPTQVIEGDFDPAAGPIIFPGKLVIKGDVPDTSEIQTNDGIEVHGMVGAAILRTHGDILIKGGASGQGYIEAGRDIRLRFVENSTLVSGRDVVVEVSAMHSCLSVGHTIFVTGGVLVGGVAKAGVAIRATKIGSPLYTSTELQVGIHPLMRSAHKRLTQQIAHLTQKRDGTQKNIEYLERLHPENTSDKMAQRISKLPLMHFRARYFSNELNKCIKRCETTRKMIDSQMEGGQIDVVREIFPGVSITVYWTTLELKENLEGVTFFEEGGKISWDSLQPESTNGDKLGIEGTSPPAPLLPGEGRRLTLSPPCAGEELGEG